MNTNDKTALEEEKTIAQQPAESIPEFQQKNHFGTWESVIIGGVPGIMLGAAGTALAQEIVNHNASGLSDKTSDANNRDTAPQATGVSVAQSVKDDMSFGEAFATAREEVGAGGVFEWHGNLYNTYTAEEWNSMKDDQKQEFANEIYNHRQNGPIAMSAPEASIADVEQVASAEQIEVSIHEVGSVANENGEIMNVAAASVDGHDALFVDADNDGYVDGVLVDANDDGIIQENEVIETPGSNVNMSYLSMMSENPENFIYDGTPDYTNDADTSSLS